MTTAIITGQLASMLRRRARQAQSRERDLRILYEQAQELAALQALPLLECCKLHDSVSQALYGISLGAHTACEALVAEVLMSAITSILVLDASASKLILLPNWLGMRLFLYNEFYGLPISMYLVRLRRDVLSYASLSNQRHTKTVCQIR